jgi:hypothetical protein
MYINRRFEFNPVVPDIFLISNETDIRCLRSCRLCIIYDLLNKRCLSTKLILSWTRAFVEKEVHTETRFATHETFVK